MRKVIAGACAAGALMWAPAGAAAHPAGIWPVDGVSTSARSENVQHVKQLGDSTGGHVVVEGNRLYMGMYGRGMRIFDINAPSAPFESGRWEPEDDPLVGPRAIADAPPDAAVFDGRHIAVLNGTSRTSRNLPPGGLRTDNTYFFDTTDPARPKLLWKFDGLHDGESHNGDIVDERRWWLPSGGRRNQTETGEMQAKNNGLRIYDLNPLLESTPRAPRTLFRGDPVTLWESSPYRGTKPVGPLFDHTHDITVYPNFEVAGLGRRDIALLAEGGSYASPTGDTGSLFVIDITDPTQPVVLLRWMHPASAGHHPIRYFHEAQFLDADPRVVLLTDEDLHSGCQAGGVTTLRLSDDLRSATELSEWFLGADGMSFAPICSLHVFSSHGNLVFFGSYSAGLQVLDFSDPANPKRVGYSVQPQADSWGAQYLRDGLVYVGDFGARGLDVFRYLGPRPDLSVLTPTLERGKGNRPSRLSTTVANQGEVATPPVAFEFLDGSQVIHTATIPALDPGETHPVSFLWDTHRLRGLHTVTAIVDPGDRIDEVDDVDNNRRSATFRLPSGH